MTDTPTPPAEAVEIVRRSQCWFSQVHAAGECCQVNRRCYTDATAALTALAAAGWTLTPPKSDGLPADWPPEKCVTMLDFARRYGLP